MIPEVAPGPANRLKISLITSGLVAVTGLLPPIEAASLVVAAAKFSEILPSLSCAAADTARIGGGAVGAAAAATAASVSWEDESRSLRMARVTTLVSRAPQREEGWEEDACDEAAAEGCACERVK